MRRVLAAAFVATVMGGGMRIEASAERTTGERHLCRPGAKFRGTRLDLDVKDADIHEVMRLLADVGDVNIVVSDKVQGKVTLRLKRVPWDQIACTIASVHKLTITANGNVILVRKD